MTYSQLDAMLAESGFDPDDVDHLATVLAPLADLSEEAPAPSAELLALMGGEPSQGATLRAVGGRAPAKRSRGVVAGAVVLALSGVGATGLSAAANTLPSPWQHQVSDFSHHYLPFDFPEPTVQLPHLAPVPDASTTVERPDPRRIAELLTEGDPDRASEEPSRSLARARSAVRGARPLLARHAGRVHDDDDENTTSDESVSRPVASGTPSASPSSSASPGARPSGEPSRPTRPATSVPVKTFAPAKPSNVAGPRHPGSPTGGKYNLLPGAIPVEGPVGGPRVEDPGTGAGKEQPAPGAGSGELPTSPPGGSTETGPVLEKAAPDDGSTSHGDAPDS